MSTLVYAGVACSLAKPAAPESRATGLTASVRMGHTEIVSPAAPRTPPPLHEGYPVAVVDPRPSLRVLRGDFEPPATLVIAYEEDWLDSIQQIISAAEGQARVLLLATRAQTQTSDLQHIAAPVHVDVLARDLDSPWVRDYGPLQTYEVDTGPLWLDFSYAWDRPVDDRFPSALSTRLHARVEHPTFELDGGAVISNGGGLCALTRTSLIDAGFTEPDSAERELFLADLGCHATAILPVIPNEPTGHADVVAQFLAPDLVMVAWLDPEANADVSRALDVAAKHLQSAAELADYPLLVVRVPIQRSGDTFFSYVNATRLRTRLLVPRFNEMPEELEKEAYSALATALPGVSVVPIEADVMVQLGGAVHCVTLGIGPTQQLLAPPLRRARVTPTPFPTPGTRTRRRG